MKQKELQKELLKWKNENIITQEQFDILSNRYKKEEEPVLRLHNRFSTQKIITFFMVMIVVLGIAAWIGEIVPWVNTLVVFASLLFISVTTLYFGDVLADQRNKTMRYTGKAIMVLGAMLFTFIFFYADLKLKSLFGINIFGKDWSLFMLVSGLLLIFVSYFTREKAVLAYSILLLLVWFISEGKIRTGSYAGTWFGLTFPFRMFLIAIGLIELGYLHVSKNSFILKFNKDRKYRIFTNTFFGCGMLIGFLPTWYASINPNWFATGVLPIKYTVLLFTVLVTLVGLFSIYLGILRCSKIFLNFGLAFVVLEVYGKFYQVFNGRLNTALFWIISIIIGIVFAGVIEYIKDHKDEIRQELLN